MRRGPPARALASLRVALCLALVVTSGCGHAPPPRPTDTSPLAEPLAPADAWPPLLAPPVPVAAPSPSTEAEPPPIPRDAAPAPRDRYEMRAPGVRVREGESQGIGFLEIVLGDVDPFEPLPMIVVIHGRGDTPRVPGGPFADLARPVRIVMPRGPMIVGSGFGWLPVRVLDGRTDLLAAGLRDVSARLARMIEELRALRPTLGRPLVSGFSQGGMLAITLAVRAPGTIGMAFPLAGWLPPPLWPEGPRPADAPPIRAMHARDDDRIPYAPSRESYVRLRARGWPIELHTFDGAGHAMSDEMNATFRAWLDEALDAIASGATRLELPRPEADDVDESPPDVPTLGEPEPPRTSREPRRARSPERPRRSRPLRPLRP